MLTEEVKTFIEILYIVYGPPRVMIEFPAKRRKTFDWTNSQRSCLKSGCPSTRMEWHVRCGVFSCKPNERRDRGFGLKLGCW